MAKSLLDSVNELLKRVGMIQGEDGELTTLTNDARQRSIDIAVQVINEGIEELYSSSEVPLPKEQSESTVILVLDTREYDLAADLVQVRWPFIDKTNNQYLFQFPGGYNAILLLDPEQDDTGLPHFAAIRPTDGKLFLDRAPTSVEAGRVYTYQYDKDVSLEAAADTVPFGDAVFRAMVPAWVQLWKRDQTNEFDGPIFNASIGRASRFLTMQQPRTHYSPR